VTGDLVDLAAVAAAALGRPVVAAEIVRREPLDYDPFVGGRSVERVTGRAVVGGATPAAPVSWAAIVKRTRGDDLAAARRELRAYQEGIARRTGPGMAAPALLGAEDGEAGVALWLEEVRDEFGGVWPIERFAIAASDMASWDAAMRAVRADGPWLEQAWAERHGQPNRIGEVLAMLSAIGARPEAAAAALAIGDPGLRRTASMISSTPERIRRLRAFPSSLLHHDLVRSNLFAVPNGRTVAIDWEVIGPGPLGVDLAPLVGGSVRRGEASADDMQELERVVLAAYISTLSTMGIREAAAVRAAYRLALGLRWHVVLGTLTAFLDRAVTGIRGSRPTEPRHEALRHMAILSRHLLDASED
jgi:hypothetical protein